MILFIVFFLLQIETSDNLENMMLCLFHIKFKHIKYDSMGAKNKLFYSEENFNCKWLASLMADCKWVNLISVKTNFIFHLWSLTDEKYVLCQDKYVGCSDCSFWMSIFGLISKILIRFWRNGFSSSCAKYCKTDNLENMILCIVALQTKQNDIRRDM